MEHFIYTKKTYEEEIPNAEDVVRLIANGARDVSINLVAHVKNKYGDFSKSNDYVNKLENCMVKDSIIKKDSESKNIYSPVAGTITLRV